MSEAEILSRIVVNPAVLTGKPVIRGLRLSVEHILRSISAGISKVELMRELPELEPEDIQACLFYAAHLVEEERVYPIT